VIKESNQTGCRAGLRRCESLVYMQADTGEMVNLAGKSQYRTALLQHREFLCDFAGKHDDRVALSMLRDMDSPNS